jgi:uncharacterized membrane protein
MFQLFNDISSFVCHQDSTRTLRLGSRLLPLCARCTGIYASFLFTWVTLQLIPATRKWVLSRPREAVPGALALATGVILAAAEAKEFFVLPLAARVPVGALAGIGLALILRPLFNQLVSLETRGKKAHHIALAAAGACLVVVTLLSLLDIKLAYYVLGYTSVLGIVLLYIVANLNVASLALNGSRGHVTRTRIINLALFTLGLILAEVLLISVLKRAVLPWLRS